MDPEVRGTVTVDLEDVPWDQALDLILKQNSLGYVLENNIMRIATSAKLQAEQSGPGPAGRGAPIGGADAHGDQEALLCEGIGPGSHRQERDVQAR